MNIIRVLRDNDYDPIEELGDGYTIICWYPEGKTVDKYEVTVTGGAKYEKFTNHDLRTVTVLVKETLGTTGKISIKIVPK